jgi:HPr kinase/phosphorylase
MSPTSLVHGTAVAVDGGAILLRGPPGAGKSDLALRLIDAGAQLVADDQVELRRSGRQILTRAPAMLAGLVEIRGIGIIRVDALEEAPLVLIVDLILSGEAERLPEPRFETVLGLAIRRIAQVPFEASAAAKLRVARRAFAAAPVAAIIGE